jgi:pimeloyl-ACP methyl ester carboxylesterase
VFHSMSALIALLHQLQGESGFAALVLLDVPICPPRNTPEDNMGIGYTMAERARYRTVKFASLEDFSESLRRSRVFQDLQPGVIELFSQTTLRPDGEGGYELRFPREYEAQVFDYYFGWTMQAYEEMERFGLSCPAKAIGADPMVPFSFLPGMKLGTLSMMEYDFIPDATHFLPLEFPQECATMATEFLEEHGLV